jgi:hypothetical protein
MITSLQDELGRRSSNPRRPGMLKPFSMSLMIKTYMGETKTMIMYAWVMEIGFGNLETEGLMVYDMEFSHKCGFKIFRHRDGLDRDLRSIKMKIPAFQGKSKHIRVGKEG